MALQTTWFVLITVVWTGFFVLEGFDFGVGMLVPFLARDDVERRVLRATIGPFWDGNEVWLVVAGGATFAAFPDWYASMFSAYYLPLFVVLVGLILRAVAVELRDKHPSTRWRHSWDGLTAASGLLVPLLIGTAFGGLLAGIPLNEDHDFTGSFVDLVQPYALGTGVLFAGLCLLQGLMFLRLKTTGGLVDRAGAIARVASWVVAALVAVHMIWTRVVVGSGVIPGLASWMALTFAVATAWLALHAGEHRGAAFVCSSAAVAFTVISFFGELHPDLMVSSTAAANSIELSDSSGAYTLTLMTIVAAVTLPVVLLYTAWSYWVFRRRVTTDDVAPSPAVAPPEPGGPPSEAGVPEPRL